MKYLHYLLILIAGCLTLILQLFIPIAGGGMSLIFVLTVPILFMISVIGILLHRYYFIKSKSKQIIYLNLYFWLIILSVLALLLYPYK